MFLECRGQRLGHRLMEAAKAQTKNLGADTFGVMVIHSYGSIFLLESLAS